jgi:putative transposase
MTDTNRPTVVTRRQCELVGLNRVTFQWQSASESPVNLALMQLIDKEYTRTPFCGYRKMTHSQVRRYLHQGVRIGAGLDRRIR